MTPDMDLLTAARAFLEVNFSCLPVMDGDSLVGRVTRHETLKGIEKWATEINKERAGQDEAHLSPRTAVGHGRDPESRRVPHQGAADRRSSASTEREPRRSATGGSRAPLTRLARILHLIRAAKEEMRMRIPIGRPRGGRRTRCGLMFFNHRRLGLRPPGRLQRLLDIRLVRIREKGSPPDNRGQSDRRRANPPRHGRQPRRQGL